MFEAIPTQTALLNIGEVEFEYCLEELVCLSENYNDLFIFCPHYYNCKIPGAINSFYLRKTAALHLIEASRNLPKGYKFKIFDAYRPLTVQAFLYENQFELNKKKYPQLDDDAIHIKTQEFVSYPYDESKPFLHGTGGAIDLTICDASGLQLNMGTEFDSFHVNANTAFYENVESTDEVCEIQENRRLLYYTMLNADFVNYPYEWWHFDYGDTVWATFKNTKAIYGKI